MVLGILISILLYNYIQEIFQLCLPFIDKGIGLSISEKFIDKKLTETIIKGLMLSFSEPVYVLYRF